MTVAAAIARKLGISASYAQRTLRRVKHDLARQQGTPPAGVVRTSTPERTGQAGNDQQRDQIDTAARSHGHLTQPDRERSGQATSEAGATRDDDARTTTTNPDRHLGLVASDRDQRRGDPER